MNRRQSWILLLALVVLGACNGGHEHPPEVAEEDERWAVTAWGEHFEIFAEADSLERGATSLAFTHVTTLEEFSPLVEGVVSVVLVDASGSEVVFSREAPTRPGIFSIDVVPETSGEFDLVFRVVTPARREDVRAGRVRVGESGSAGALVEAAATAAEAEKAAGGAEISFLKEQQWRTEFATSWVREGALGESVAGPGRVEAAAGGEILLTSPVDGVVSATSWPFPGQQVGQGAVVFRVTPRVAADRSLAELEASATGLEAELDLARRRLARLDGLLEIGATSQREREEAQVRVTTLESRHTAASRDLATARTGRRGGAATTEAVAVRAPFPARIARVDLTPGQAVAAAAPLGLLVRDHPLWLEVALRPEAAAGLKAPEGLDVRLSNGRAPMTFRGDRARFVSLSPKVDPATGAVTALFEVDASVEELPIGSLVEVQVLLAQERRGIVVPETALVDDGGVPVVYLQIGGESFVRSEVSVVGRQSGRALVEGLQPGARVVDRGGNAIRRATLVASDVGEAHIH
jgi:RND family efflux transporter MFP subunit